MFTYSHANRSLGQSERAFYLSYFHNILKNYLGIKKTQFLIKYILISQAYSVTNNKNELSNSVRQTRIHKLQSDPGPNNTTGANMEVSQKNGKTARPFCSLDQPF